MFRLLLTFQGVFFLVGGAWMALAGYAFVKTPDPARDAVAFLLLFGTMAGLEALFSRLFPASFLATEALHRQLGQMLRQLGLSHHQALLLALASGLGEEVFFRGALQNALPGGMLAVFLQALFFAVLHPTPDRKAWAYPLFTLIAGVVFGFGYYLTGSLVPGILAHYLNNAKSFYQLLEQKSQA